MVFAHLIHHQMEAVLDFLSTVPGPTGKPALEFVLTEWCSKQHLFYGLYEAKIRCVLNVPPQFSFFVSLIQIHFVKNQTYLVSMATS